MEAEKIPAGVCRLEDLDTFQWWIARRRRRLFRISVLVAALVGFVEVGMILAGPQLQQTGNVSGNVTDTIFGALALFFFLWLAVSLFVRGLKLGTVKPTDVHRVAVTGKSRYSKTRSRRSDNRAYYLTAVIDQEPREALCEVETYRKVKIGDPVVFFKLGSQQYFAIHLRQV